MTWQADPQRSLPQDTRNDFSGRRDLLFRVYVLAVALAGCAVLALTVGSPDLASLLSLEPALWVVCGLLLAAELRPLFTAGARDVNGLVLSTSGMQVVAEGVEDDATWRLLQEMGCDEAQGWLLARAEPAGVLTPWLLARQARLSEQVLRG